MTGFTLSLPFPPSANRIWRFVPGQPTPLKSAEYRTWLKAAKAECWGARGVQGHFHLRIIATAPDRRRRDLDNLCKPVADLLTQAGLIEDDSLAQSIHLEWTATPVKGGSVLVTVTPVEVEPVASQALMEDAA